MSKELVLGVSFMGKSESHSNKSTKINPIERQGKRYIARLTIKGKEEKLLIIPSGGVN